MGPADGKKLDADKHKRGGKTIHRIKEQLGTAVARRQPHRNIVIFREFKGRTRCNVEHKGEKMDHVQVFADR